MEFGGITACVYMVYFPSIPILQQVDEKPASSATEAEVVCITPVTDKAELRLTNDHHLS